MHLLWIVIRNCILIIFIFLTEVQLQLSLGEKLRADSVWMQWDRCCEWNYHMIHVRMTRDIVGKDTIYKRCGNGPEVMETKVIVIDFSF